MTRAFTLAAILLALGACSQRVLSRDPVPCPGAGADAPEAVACGFYAAVVEAHPVGLPSSEEMTTLAPYLSTSLRSAIEEARAYQAAYATAHPDEKPPFADGSLFTSLFEGADRFELVRVDEGPGRDTGVVVRLGYQDAAPWEDTVVLRREEGRLVVADVVFGGAGAFNPPGRLSEMLRERE